jgi:TMEM199 family protein
MVLLTMTPSIVEALKLLDVSTLTSDQDKEPSLTNGEPGKPISHGQIIDVWKQLRANGIQTYTLEGLLRSATVYIPPPPPKPEPVCQDVYKNCMCLS